jgi:predicted dehydrogenase/acetyltransferase-like isoleucine patch superfamily enzyme
MASSMPASRKSPARGRRPTDARSRRAPVPGVAVIGCGYWGQNLVRNFAELGALVAVCDLDPTRADEFAARHRVPARSLTEILTDPAIANVVVATPAETHAAVAREALQAGKNVFVEKPLALAVADAEGLVSLAAERGRVLMVGHVLQYHPAFLKLQALVGEGGLGRLQYIYSNRLSLGRFRREENILWSFAPHDISMILALVGGMPESVEATGSSYLHKTLADVTTTHLKFADGENAHVFVSWLHPFKEQKLVVVGDRGMAVFDDTEPWERKLIVFGHKIAWKGGLPTAEKADGKPIALAADEPLKRECQHFLDCIAGKVACRSDGAEGVRVLKVLQAAEQAMRCGERVALRTGATSDFFVHETACIDAPAAIGAGTRIWHFTHVLANTRIGKGCTIGQNVMLGPNVTVGDRCKIQNNVSVYPGVTLEDGVFCGPSCVFTNVLNPRAEIERKDEFRPTLVRRGATIGANATVVCGTELGEYCFIGAGAVVTKDVPPFALMVGAPARRIGWMSHAGERLGSDLVCKRSGRRYAEVAPGRLQALD